MEEDIPRSYSIAQKRALFFRFVEFNDPHFNDELKAKVCIHAARGEQSAYDYMIQTDVRCSSTKLKKKNKDTCNSKRRLKTLLKLFNLDQVFLKW